MLSRLQGERLGYPRGYEETREGDAHSKLPVYVFLDQFERDVGTLTLVTNDFHSLMTRWWSSDGPRDQSFTGSRVGNRQMSDGPVRCELAGIVLHVAM